MVGREQRNVELLNHIWIDSEIWKKRDFLDGASGVTGAPGRAERAPLRWMIIVLASGSDMRVS